MDAIKEGMLASAKAAEAAARIGERLFCQNTPNVMNFNSQICTSREQSKRLLALGLKKETSDCCYYYYDGEYLIAFAEDAKYPSDIPAWSLHRLIEMIGDMFEMQHWLGFNIEKDYEHTIDCIQWLIEDNRFNKEYLRNDTNNNFNDHRNDNIRCL